MWIALGSSYARWRALLRLVHTRTGEGSNHNFDTLSAMKYGLSRLPMICLLLVGFAYSQEPLQPAVSLKPDTGTFFEDTYRSNYFGFSYPLEEGWFENETLSTKTSANEGTGISGHFQLLVVDRHTGNSMRERVIIFADKASQFPSTDVAGLLSKVARAQIRNPQTKLLSDALPATYAGRKFYRAEWAESYSGGTLFKAMA